MQLVGPGTPAAEAGLKPGDVIKTMARQSGRQPPIARRGVGKDEAGAEGDAYGCPRRKETDACGELRRRPLDVIQPEGDDPLSMLLTLQQYDDAKLGDQENKQQEAWEAQDQERKRGTKEEEAQLDDSRYLGLIAGELKGVSLRTANWKVVTDGPRRTWCSSAADCRKWDWRSPKRIAWSRCPTNRWRTPIIPRITWSSRSRFATSARKPHKVAYRLDGPNGLPMEGKWYAYRVSRNWGGAGLRDFVVSFGGRPPEMIGASNIGAGEKVNRRPDTPPLAMLTFIGVNAQYFSAVLMPQRQNPTDAWFDELYAHPGGQGRSSAPQPTQHVLPVGQHRGQSQAGPDVDEPLPDVRRSEEAGDFGEQRHIGWAS